MTASLRLNTVEAQRLMAGMRAAGVNTIYIRFSGSIFITTAAWEVFNQAGATVIIDTTGSPVQVGKEIDITANPSPKNRT